MKKITLLLITIALGFTAFSQTYNALPAGSKPYGNQLYLTADGLILGGSAGLKFRVIGTKHYVDSLVNLRYTNAQIDAISAAKQEALISGTNIKTVNGTTLLGSGNLGVGTVTSISSSTTDATVANPPTTPIITVVSAPKLTTARTIGGTPFDGTANITPALATTVTTNANLTGVVTSVGNATSIANGVISNAMLANGAVANLSGTNTGDVVLTTTGSGVASLTGQALNIPNTTYTLPTATGSVLGGVKVGAGLTITSGVIATNNNGTVTNVAATNGTGQTFTITNPTTTPNISLTLTKDAVVLGNVDNTSDANKPVSTATQNALNLKANIAGQVFSGNITATNLSGANTGDQNLAPYQLIATKILSNGYAALDENGKVPLIQINDALIGSVNYQGNYDASNNTPALPSATGNKGKYYVVSVAGTQQSLAFIPGDWIISNGAIWQRVDNNNKVNSVNGQVGTISLSKSDVGLANVDNTSDATKNSATATLTNKSISGGQITSAVSNATLASTVTTNANLTGDVTSVGNATTYNGIVPLAKGGTGSSTQNFVDLTNNQTIAGAKTFSKDIVISGASSAQQFKINIQNSNVGALTLANASGTAHWSAETDPSSTGAQGEFRIKNQIFGGGTNAVTISTSNNIIAGGTVTAPTFIGALTGNASTVTTNANLTGIVTSTGNATNIAANAITDGYISSAANWNSKEPAISKNTAFNKNFGSIAGTVLEGRTFGTAANNNSGDFTAANSETLQSVTSRGATTTTGMTLGGALTGTSATFSGVTTANGEASGFIVDASLNDRLGMIKAAGFSPEIRYKNDPFTIRLVTAGTLVSPTTSTNVFIINTSGNATFSGAGNFGSTLSAVNGNFTITEDATNVYLQSFGSKTLKINNLGNPISLGSGLTGTNATFSGAVSVSGAFSNTSTLFNRGQVALGTYDGGVDVPAETTYKLTIGDGNSLYTHGSITSVGSVTSTQYKLSALNTAPASATATGTLGEIRITATYIYVCTATNTWVRTPLTTW